MDRGERIEDRGKRGIETSNSWWTNPGGVWDNRAKRRALRGDQKMYWEINVSKNGRHFFATAERSAVTEGEAWELWKELKKVFPPNEGFYLDVVVVRKQSVNVTEAFEGRELGEKR